MKKGLMLAFLFLAARGMATQSLVPGGYPLERQDNTSHEHLYSITGTVTSTSDTTTAAVFSSMQASLTAMLANPLTVTASVYTGAAIWAAPGTITAATGSWTNTNLSFTAGAASSYDVMFQNLGTADIRLMFLPSGTAPGATQMGFKFTANAQQVAIMSALPSGWSVFAQGDTATATLFLNVLKK